MSRKLYDPLFDSIPKPIANKFKETALSPPSRTAPKGIRENLESQVLIPASGKQLRKTTVGGINETIPVLFDTDTRTAYPCRDR